MIKVELPKKITTKKNSYVIHYSRAFWAHISKTISYYPKAAWIDTSAEYKQTEKLIALTVKMAARKNGTKDPIEGKVRLEILYPGRADLDNVASTILDGIEASGVIANDRQVSELVVRRKRGAKTTVTIQEV